MASAVAAKAMAVTLLFQVVRFTAYTLSVNGSGIGGGYNGSGSDITISGGSVQHTLMASTTLKVATSAVAYNGNNNNIYISGGSVKAQTLDIHRKVC